MRRRPWHVIAARAPNLTRHYRLLITDIPTRCRCGAAGAGSLQAGLLGNPGPTRAPLPYPEFRAGPTRGNAAAPSDLGVGNEAIREMPGPGEGRPGPASRSWSFFPILRVIDVVWYDFSVIKAKGSVTYPSKVSMRNG